MAQTLAGALSDPATVGDIRESMSLQAGVRLAVEGIMEPAAMELEAALSAALGPER